ncbi:MAG: hydantoinase/oxoprolinase family protein [Methanomassiliicoccales archaeon]|jgi:N-methylhydantoinase A/oxoprolinase/acetone carboxylase beta subunit
MDVGLGIDTGGTFTDAALVDIRTNKVIAKGKAHTTYQDLTVGITAAVKKALSEGSVAAADIKLIGLSTTLATNSILQDRGGRVGLIGIGWTPGEGWRLGTDKARFVGGGYDSLGRMMEPLDEATLALAINELLPQVDAIAVSGMFSVSNPTQEVVARDMIRKLKPDMPVVVGHSLTSELGIKERTVTAVLNAKLIPIIRDFLASVERALKSMDVHGRILVFKGDGGLMTMESAVERPVETILSGPAASLMGGRALSGLDTCIVVDVGGTSTDIAFLDNGFPVLSSDGAVVGGWKTRVKAISMWTTGLGGDSLVVPDDHDEVVLGPQRVVPIAIASTGRPDLKKVMLENRETTFYVAGKQDVSALTEGERKVHNHVVANGPRSFFELMDGVPDVIFLKDAVQALVSRGNLLRTGITPTDIMHSQGVYVEGDVEAARIAIALLAEKMNMDPSDLEKKIMVRCVTRVGEEIVKKIMEDKVGGLPSDYVTDQLLHLLVGESLFPGLQGRMKLDRPIIGIGAPAKEFILPLKERMDADVVIPDHFDVGNAVGAVLSEITESITVQVYPREGQFLILSSLSSPIAYSHIEEAISSAKRLAENHVQGLLDVAGTDDVNVRIELIERRFSDGYGKEMKFMNWIDVRATGKGKPRYRS